MNVNQIPQWPTERHTSALVNADLNVVEVLSQEIPKRVRDVPSVKDQYEATCRATFAEMQQNIRLQRVPLGELKLGGWNRVLSPASVTRIYKEFDPILLKPLVLSLKPNGDYIILDGQHRTAALRKLGFSPDARVPAIVLVGMTEAQDAGYFLRLNKDRHVGPTDRFKARLVSGDASAAALQRVFDAVGLKVRYSGGDKPDNIAAVEAAEDVYESAGGGAEGERVLTAALQACVQSWDFDKSNTDHRLVRAMGALALFGGERFSADHMVSHIKQQRLTINDAFQQAATRDKSNIVPALSLILVTRAYHQGYVPRALKLNITGATSLDSLRLLTLRTAREVE